MKRKLLNMIAATSTLTIAPVVLVSCSFNISGNTSLSKPAQIELIQKHGKTNVLNEWLLATFSTLYVDKILDPEGSFGKTKREEAIGEIANFLIYLKWSDSTTNKEAKKSPLSSDEQKEVEKVVYDAYKFLVIFRSSVSTGTEDIPSPADYFVKKAAEWKKDQITTIDHQSLMGFNPLPGILPTQTDWKSDNNFSLLFKAWGTGIFSDTLKILMGQMYFLHADEKEIKNGTDYNKQTRTKFNKNWLEATSFDVQDDFYFLNKYLVTKNPQFKWEKKEDTASGYVTNIKDSTDFNNLMGPTKVTLDPFLAPLTSDTIEFSTTKADSNKDAKLEALKGFTKLEYDSAITDGDLSVSMDNIKTFGFEKSGLLNTDNNNALVGFGALKAVQVAKTKSGNSSSGTSTKYGLPSIKIKESSLKKDVRNIDMNDLDMEFDSKTGSVDTATGNLTLKGDNNQSWEVVKLSFLPQETGSETEQKINLSVKYKLKDDNQKDLMLPYSFDITWTRKDASSQTTPFDKPFMFSEDKEELNKMFPTYIKSTNEGKPDFSYILKPLPIFDTKNSQAIEIEKQAYMTGKFSLENTIWKSTTTKSKDGKDPKRNDDAKIKLVNWFVLSDDGLWSQIQDFYLFNNYNIDAKNGEFSPIISELGLTKKTDKDRKDAGIIF